MANRRMIAGDFFEDEFVGQLDHFERLLWIGLIVAVADDQGRLFDSPALIRAKVFLFDNITDDQVEEALNKLWRANKIIRYEKGGKKLIQIMKWWIYQTPSWASASKYPAPDNWVDREKYHAPGNKVVTNNWDKDGGLHSPLYSAEDSAIDDVKGDVNGEDEVKAGTTAFSDLSVAFVNTSGLPELSGGVRKYTESLNKMVELGVTPQDLETAIRELREKNYNIISPGSCINAALNVMGKRKGAKGVYKGKEFIPSEVINDRAN